MPPRKKLKTPEQVRADFLRRGISIAGWARQHRVSESLVRAVLSKRMKGHRGQSHEIAVLLGLKDGVIDRHHREAA